MTLSNQHFYFIYVNSKQPRYNFFETTPVSLFDEVNLSIRHRYSTFLFSSFKHSLERLTCVTKNIKDNVSYDDDLLYTPLGGKRNGYNKMHLQPSQEQTIP